MKSVPISFYSYYIFASDKVRMSAVLMKKGGQPQKQILSAGNGGDTWIAAPPVL